MKDSTQCVERQELYDEVWAEPVSIVAQRYGISDVGLAKVCKKHRIPLPGRGYWAKVKAGIKMSRIPLPKLNDESEDSETMQANAKNSGASFCTRNIYRCQGAAVLPRVWTTRGCADRWPFGDL